MVGTRDLHRLIAATTEAGAKLVLVGDHKQLAEIEAGGLFAALARHLGAAELTENRRLQVPAQAATARALRDGKVDRALLRLRRGSGGAGSAPGGEGIERDLQVLVDATVSLITERRVSQPWGLAGGEPGAVGENWLLPGGDEERAERLPDM
jgi:hypothetical protein